MKLKVILVPADHQPEILFLLGYVVPFLSELCFVPELTYLPAVAAKDQPTIEALSRRVAEIQSIVPADLCALCLHSFTLHCLICALLLR